MAYFLFVDESGQDQKDSPYEVLAGIAIEDKKLWPLILELRDAELRLFGCRYSADLSELKARRLLKKKTFNLASRCDPIAAEERTELAKACLQDGPAALPRNRAALAQAKLVFVDVVLRLCKKHGCKVFASIVATNERNYNPNFLRKDYSFLFERFFYFLQDMGGQHCGVVVFDELEKTKSHLLVEQLALYFRYTQRGQERAELLIPEPLFVHSHLTTGVQIADLAAYLLSWGFRTTKLTKPSRDELRFFVDKLSGMRYKSVRAIPRLGIIDVWSIAIIEDLRARVTVRQAG